MKYFGDIVHKIDNPNLSVILREKTQFIIVAEDYERHGIYSLELTQKVFH